MASNMWAMWSILMCQPMVCQGTALLTSHTIHTIPNLSIPYTPYQTKVQTHHTKGKRADLEEPHCWLTETRGGVWSPPVCATHDQVFVFIFVAHMTKPRTCPNFTMPSFLSMFYSFRGHVDHHGMTRPNWVFVLILEFPNFLIFLIWLVWTF